MPKLNSLEVVHQDTNKDQFETLHDILVGLRNSLAVNKEIVDGDARVAIENLLEMYVNDKEAFLRSLQTLTAQFKTSEAKYEEEILLQASALEALARRTTTLTAQTENNIASVREYSEAVASETARKVSTYNQPEPPTENLTYGDLWFDTDNNNKLYWWNGLVWSESSDTYNLNDFINTTYASDYAAIEAQVDSKAETWFQTADPSTAWTTQEIRDLHDKDLWYSTATKLLKIYTASTNTWTIVQDQAAIDAATAASAAQETADGKIVTFVQSTTPTAEGIGDLWMDTANNRQMKRWDGSSWVAVDDARIASTYARWGVKVDANGNVAGIQLNSNSSGTSEFTVVANNFKVYGSGGQKSIQNPLDVTVAGSTQRVGIGNAMIVYYEGTKVINRWAAINNVKCSGIYSRPTASAIVDLPYSWANEAAGFFAGNAGIGGNHHGIRGAVFTNNGTSLTSRGIVGSHTGAAFYAEVGSYAPFTGSHQSVVNKGYEIQEGQIVVDKEIVMKKDISNTLSRVEKSSTPNQKGVIGVFTSNIGPMSKISTLAVIAEHRVDDGFGNLTGPLTEQYDQIKDLYDVVSINALGEGQILVCGENGSISTGDLIVTSSVEGVGMKQADDVIRSYTVAKAREDVTFEDSTTPKLVPCIYLCG